MKEQVVTFSKFRTINVMKDIFKLAPDELAMAVNVDLTEDGKVVQRAGLRKIQAFSDTPFVFSWNEIYQGGVYPQLLCIAGTAIYRFDEAQGIFVQIANTLQSGTKWGGAGYVDKFIFSNGQKIYKLTRGTNGYAVEDISSITNIPKGTLFAVYGNRLVIAGDGKENVYFSNIGDPLTWVVNDFVAFSGIVTAIYTVSDILFVGTDNALYKVVKTGDANIPYKVETVMNVGILGITEFTGGSVCCLTSDQRIAVFSPYVQSGEQINDRIGLPIRDLLPCCNNPLFIMCKTPDNRVIIDAERSCLVLSPYTLGFTMYKSPSSQYISMGIKSSAIYKSKHFIVQDKSVLIFDSDIYHDDGVDFDTFIDTEIIGGDTQNIQKNFRHVNIITNSIKATNIDLYVAVNVSTVFRDIGSNWVTGAESRLGFAYVGGFLLGGVYAQQSKFRIDVNSNTLQLRIKRALSNSDMKISDISVYFYQSFRT